MEFSYSTILGKITKKIDITKFLHLHFYKKSYAIVYTPPTFPPTHKSHIPIGGGWGSCGMKRIKKPLRWGCEGWRPIVGVMPKSNGKQAPPLSFAVTPTVARDARPSHPSPYRKKSRFAKKKSAPPKKNTPAVFFLSHEFIKLLRVLNLPSLRAGLRRGLRHLPAMR